MRRGPSINLVNLVPRLGLGIPTSLKNSANPQARLCLAKSGLLCVNTIFHIAIDLNILYSAPQCAVTRSVTFNIGALLPVPCTHPRRSLGARKLNTLFVT